jgi:uncharacterized SAM-dependent methyltransferase
MHNYSQAKIYTIRNKKNSSRVYVVSTTQSLSQRLAEHKFDSKRYPDIHFYKVIGDKWDNWELKLYENYPCKNKAQLMKRENEIVKKIGNLNSIDIGETLRVKKK